MLQRVTVPRGARDIDFLRSFSKLERFSYDEDEGNAWRPTLTAAEFWREWDAAAAVTKALAKSGMAAKEIRGHSRGRCHVDLEQSGATDLSPLRGLPIASLRLGGNDVADLSPLRGMPLTELLLYPTAVVDLKPLEGMPLEHLNLVSTGVVDLAPLRKMPLVYLRLARCNALFDVSALKGMTTLKELTLPPGAVEVEFLRALPNLERLSYNEDVVNGKLTMPPPEFWADLPRIRPLLKLRAQAMKQVGGDADLEMEVKSSAHSDAGDVTLNSAPDSKNVENVAVHLRADVAAAFKAKQSVENLAEHYRGKRIRVSGKATLSNGSPVIAVDSADQLTALDDVHRKLGTPVKGMGVTK